MRLHPHSLNKGWFDILNDRTQPFYCVFNNSGLVAFAASSPPVTLLRALVLYVYVHRCFYRGRRVSLSTASSGRRRRGRKNERQQNAISIKRNGTRTSVNSTKGSRRRIKLIQRPI